MTFAIDFTPSPLGFLSTDRLRRWVPWVQASPAIQDIETSSSTSVTRRHVPDPLLERRLQEIASLAPGWDDGTARSVAPELIDLVKDFISSEVVGRISVKPDLVPSFSGGVLIEWHTEEVDLIIELDPSTGPSFYFYDNETSQEVEAPLGEEIRLMTTAFVKLMQHQ